MIKNEKTNCTNLNKGYEKYKTSVFALIGATLLTAGLYSCSNDDATTADNITTEQKTTASKSFSDLIPSEEVGNVHRFFTEYYKVAGELRSALEREDLHLDLRFESRMQEVRDLSQMRNLFAEYRFSNPDFYVNEVNKVSTLQRNLRETSPVLFQLDESTRESIVLEIGDIVFEELHPINTVTRTCKEQYNIDLDRAEKTYAGCGAVAVLTAGISGPIGRLIAGGGCMYFYYNDINNAKQDYEDCLNSRP